MGFAAVYLYFPIQNPPRKFSIAEEIMNEYQNRVHGKKLDVVDVHGWLGRSQSWSPPVRVTYCDAEARPGYSSILAHEYNDEPAVLKEKVKVLVQLMLGSEYCIVYTGAGISTPSGIGDYATQVQREAKPLLRSPMEAQPTLTHFALAELYRRDIVKRWVQQNHDGLPQKAGLPQAGLNEIHGAWFDPSNPVVVMSGQLRDDLFRDLLQLEQRADLTLSIGTSMCGMNSDRVFTTVAKRAKKVSECAVTSGPVNGQSLGGGVIVGLQQTQYDYLACLKVYATADEVMRLVAEELKLSIHLDRYHPSIPPSATEGLPEDPVFRVPYDEAGYRIISEGCGGSGVLSRTTTILDLREGARVKLTAGPYAADEGEVIGTNLEGHYRIVFNHKLNPNKSLRRAFERVLGSWWIEAATTGSVAQLPVVNIS